MRLIVGALLALFLSSPSIANTGTSQTSGPTVAEREHMREVARVCIVGIMKFIQQKKTEAAAANLPVHFWLGDGSATGREVSEDEFTQSVATDCVIRQLIYEGSHAAGDPI